MSWLATKIFPRPNFIYEELPEENEPCVYVANHSGPVGPVYAALYYKGPRKIWLINYIMQKKKNVKFIYHDFLTAKKKDKQWFWKCLSRIISFLLTPLLLKIPHIKVYHDSRMLDTFRESLSTLQEGKSIVIFPECPTKYSDYVNSFYDGFAEIGRIYYAETGKRLKFYPTYNCKDLLLVSVGKPIVFDPDNPAKKERKRIAEETRNAISELAEKLPEHKPHPFLTQTWYDDYAEYLDNMSEYWKMFD